jgi:hypothetical protein
MFKESDVKEIFDRLENNYPGAIQQDNRLKYISNKIKKYGYLWISTSEYNYLLYVTGRGNIRYNITKLKDILKANSIGYTSIIKNIGIPKATLSKMLNGERNTKLAALNAFFKDVDKIYNLKITKENIREGE